MGTSSTTSRGCIGSSHPTLALGSTGLHPLARAWMAGLRHKARHKFLPEEVSAKSRPVPLFLQIGVISGTGVKIGKLQATQPAEERETRSLVNPNYSIRCDAHGWAKCSSASSPVSDKSAATTSLDHSSYSSFTIQTSERGVPLLSLPSCASQFDVNKKKRPFLEILPKGWVLK